MLNGSIQDEMDSTQNAYDTIEADIDALKVEVQRLKEEDAMKSPRAQPQSSLRAEELGSAHGEHKAPLPVSEPVSAAARLQRAHEILSQKPKTPIIEQEKPPVALVPFDFPELSTTKPIPKPRPASSDKPDRKPSYAKIATSGMMEAIEQAFSGVAQSGAKSVSSDHTTSVTSESSFFNPILTSYTASIPDPCTENKHQLSLADDHCVEKSFVAAQTDDTRCSDGGKPYINNCTATASKPQTTKQPPGFAQPTKAFIRRADETTYKNTVSCKTKVNGDGSPTKPTRKTTQRQAKRKSLPGDWTAKPDKPGLDGQSPPESSPADVESDNPGEELLHRTHHRHENGNDMEVTEEIGTALPDHKQRQKGSTYMSPTKATVQRTIATLGQDHNKRTSPRGGKSQCQLDTLSSPRKDTRPLHQTNDESLVQQLNQAVEQLSNGNSFACQSETELSAIQLKPSTNSFHVPDNSEGRHDTSLGSYRKHDAFGKCAPRTPRRMTVGESFDGKRGAKSTANGLPDVANVTTKRRVSHGHLLKPIRAKLNRIGLLNDKASSDALPMAASFLSGVESLGNGTRPVHHERSRTHALTSVQSPLSLKEEPAHLCLKANTDPLVSSDLVVKTTPCPEAHENLEPADCKTSQPPSLRATAQEFKPMWKPETFEQEFGVLSWEGSLDFRPENEWLMLSPRVRQSIQRLREFKMSGSRASNAERGSNWSPERMSKAATQRFWANLMSEQSPCCPTGSQATDHPAARVGQVLKPHSIPGQNDVHWTLQNLDGEEVPIHFGRAPAPPHAEPRTPVISPNSDDTSPLKSPLSSPRGWTIGSTQTPWIYGWTGGDGREIRFVGHGPDAERDPSTPVNFQFSDDKENVFATASPAPSSIRQWAEKVGYPKVPCGNMQITHAFEQLPVPVAYQSAGYCFDCSLRNF